jgi:hypothetical protein
MAAHAATPSPELQLQDALQAAMSRQSKKSEPIGYSASAWLAALPSIDVTLLRSEDSNGTDETEVGLNLPLKSPYLHQQDKRLTALNGRLVETDRQRRQLYYSGLIREAIWSARLARERSDQASKKISLLEQLADREQTLVATRNSTQYGLLLIQQELIDARLTHLDQQAEQQRWLQVFRELTGMAHLPTALTEASLPGNTDWRTHPALQLLDLNWQQQQALIAAASSRATPWNLRIGATEVATPGFDETQYGITVELPLSFSNSIDEASRSTWQEGVRSYDRDREQLITSLAQTWQQLTQEAMYLRERQSLLDQSALVSAKVREQANKLQELNELGREMWINRLIADLDRQSQSEINRLLIGQNNAMRRQAAGISL